MTPEKVWDYVDASGDCWEWTGAHLPSGYGSLRDSERGRSEYAHRYVYRLLCGFIPAGKQIDHRCRNRGCVNPDHLSLVTSQENSRRGFGLAAKYGKRTHCYRGHEYTPENTRLIRGKWRVCKQCESIGKRVRYLKRVGSLSRRSPYDAKGDPIRELDKLERTLRRLR